MAFNYMTTIRHICEKIGSTSSISWWWSAISLLQRNTETRLQRCSDEQQGMPSLWDPPATNLGWQTQGPSNIAPSSSTTCLVSIRIVVWFLPSDDQLYFSKRDRESSSIQHCTSLFCSLSKLDKILESCLVKSIRKVKKVKVKSSWGECSTVIVSLRRSWQHWLQRSRLPSSSSHCLPLQGCSIGCPKKTLC